MAEYKREKCYMHPNASLAEFLAAISSGRHGVPVSIDEAQAISGLDRAAVLDRFRKLQANGDGYLKLGRHGHPTRFYFRSPSSTKAPSLDAKMPLQAAKLGPLLKLDNVGVDNRDTQGRGDETVTQEPQANSIQAKLIEHRFQLRDALQVSIRLPADLTDREAARLAKFIEALPF